MNIAEQLSRLSELVAILERNAHSPLVYGVTLLTLGFIAGICAAFVVFSFRKGRMISCPKCGNGDLVRGKAPDSYLCGRCRVLWYRTWEKHSMVLPG